MHGEAAGFRSCPFPLHLPKPVKNQQQKYKISTTSSISTQSIPITQKPPLSSKHIPFHNTQQPSLQTPSLHIPSHSCSLTIAMRLQQRTHYLNRRLLGTCKVKRQGSVRVLFLCTCQSPSKTRNKNTKYQQQAASPHNQSQSRKSLPPLIQTHPLPQYSNRPSRHHPSTSPPTHAASPSPCASSSARTTSTGACLAHAR